VERRLRSRRQAVTSLSRVHIVLIRSVQGKQESSVNLNHLVESRDDVASLVSYLALHDVEVISGKHPRCSYHINMSTNLACLQAKV
jgi:hypothetical protein